MTVRKLRTGFTLGADPEFFLFRKSPSGKSSKFISASGLIPGTKDKPFKVNKGAIQVDGFAAEINIDPAKTFDEFDANLSTVLSELKQRLDSDIVISNRITMDIPKAIFEAADPQTYVLGCDPDFDAWTGQLNKAPDLSYRPQERWVGGHLHIGWTDGEDPNNLMHRAACFDFVKQLDWYLGTWSAQKDLDKSRRSAYGIPGACRVKHYGVEYRTMSSFWCHSSDLRLEVWNRTCAAIDDMRERYAPTKYGLHNCNVKDSILAGILPKSLGSKYVYPIQTIEL